MLVNPFLEGLILVLVGIACMIAGAIWKVDGLPATGQTILGIGIGYFAKTAVENSQK